MSTYTVMNVSLMDHDTHREAKCINNNVFLAPFDLFVAVNDTIGSNVMGGLDTSGSYLLCPNDNNGIIIEMMIVMNLFILILYPD